MQFKGTKLILALALGAPLGWAQAAMGQQLNAIVAAETQRNQEAANSQAKIDKLYDETNRLVDEYRDVSRQLKDLRAYNAQLDRLVKDQSNDIASLQEQIDDVESVERKIMPLMMRMTDGLEQFVALDIPFLEEERKERIANLRLLMDESDVTVAEKYRRLLEAYQIESEFGRTIEAYQGSLDFEDGTRSVDFLRLGRVGLYYQTFDASRSGMWDNDKRAWAELPSKYRDSIKEGLRIARKRAAPDLLYLPMPTARPAEAKVTQ